MLPDKCFWVLEFMQVWCLWDSHAPADGFAGNQGQPLRCLRWAGGWVFAGGSASVAAAGICTNRFPDGASQRRHGRTAASGLAALPQVVLPDIYGTTEKGSTFISPWNEPNPLESTTAAYTGVFATLLVAPLAWCSRRHRAINAFWIFLAFFGLSWSLNVPVFVGLLRLPGLNMMSHNRLVFLTSFAILALTATRTGNAFARLNPAAMVVLAAGRLAGRALRLVRLPLPGFARTHRHATRVRCLPPGTLGLRSSHRGRGTDSSLVHPPLHHHGGALCSGVFGLVAGMDSRDGAFSSVSGVGDFFDGRFAPVWLWPQRTM